MNQEQKYKIQEDISEILNDTGAYNQITDIIKRKYNIELDSDSPIFNYIEEAMVDMILSID